jgi:hypothetical protein
MHTTRLPAYQTEREWAEKRESERIRAAASVRLFVEDEDGSLVRRHGQLIDLSEGGCGFRCYKPVPMGARGVLQLEVDGETLSMGVEIRWVRHDAYTWKVGCQFTEHGVGQVAVRTMLQTRRRRRAAGWTPEVY